MVSKVLQTLIWIFLGLVVVDVLGKLSYFRDHVYKTCWSCPCSNSEELHRTSWDSGRKTEEYGYGRLDWV